MKKILFGIISIFIFVTILVASSINEELFIKAERYYKVKAYKKAVSIYEGLLKEKDFKDRELLLFHLGYSYYYLKQKEKAYHILKQLFSEYPKTRFLKSGLNIVLDYLKTKQEYEEALTILKDKRRFLKNDDDIKSYILEIYEYSEQYIKAIDFLEKNYPVNLWSIERKAYYLRELKEYDKAIVFIKQNLAAHSKLKLYQLLADLNELKKDYTQSIYWYNKIYNQTKNINDLINQARMLFSNNQISDGQKTVKRIIKIIGEKVHTYRIVSKIYQEFGLYDELILLYDQGIKKGYDFKKDRINVYEIMGRYEQALDEYMKFLSKKQFRFVSEKVINMAIYEEQLLLIEKLMPKYHKKYTSKRDLILKIELSLYIKLNQFEKIYKILNEQYFNVDNVDLNFLDNVFNYLFQMEHYDYIVRIYQIIPKKLIKKIHSIVSLRYAQALYLVKDYQKALSVLRKVKDKRFKDNVTYYRALCYTGLNKIDNAIRLVKKQNNYNAHHLLFKLLLMKKDYKQAEQIVKKEMKKRRFPKSNLFFENIIMNLFQNQYVIIIKDMTKFLELYPQADEANDLIIMLYFLKNDSIKKNEKKQKELMKYFQFRFLDNHQQAINVLEKQKFNSSHNNMVKYYYLAQSYIVLNQNKLAEKELKKALKAKSFIKPFALEMLGWLYLNKYKDKKTAYQYYKQILASYPSFINANNIRKLMIE